LALESVVAPRTAVTRNADPKKEERRRHIAPAASIVAKRCGAARGAATEG
jgi:hypothetical protein